jgi:hemerythrin-like domain-containing protein
MYSLDRLLAGGREQGATIENPLEHLGACHNRIEERLQVLERAAGALETQPEEARSALAAVFRYFDTSGVLHTRDEEESVFPRLEAHLAAADIPYIAALESQHREAESVYEELRKPPAPGADLRGYRENIERFCALYRAHIASENERLIALARDAFSEQELTAITGEMKQRRGLR